MGTMREGGPARAVFARHAASLILVREGEAGPEVLMGRRAKAHRFMPDALVFPGGAVDPGDATLPAATEPDGALMATLQRSCGPRLARGIVQCAARELWEETGLSLGSPPRLDRLRYLCRAVTPPDSPIRFNARFLVAPAAVAAGVPTDSAELSALAFRPVAVALGEELAVVTRAVLERLLASRATGGEPEPGPSGDAGGERWIFRLRSWSRDR